MSSPVAAHKRAEPDAAYCYRCRSRVVSVLSTRTGLLGEKAGPIMSRCGGRTRVGPRCYALEGVKIPMGRGTAMRPLAKLLWTLAMYRIIQFVSCLRLTGCHCVCCRRRPGEHVQLFVRESAAERLQVTTTPLQRPRSRLPPAAVVRQYSHARRVRNRHSQTITLILYR